MKKGIKKANKYFSKILYTVHGHISTSELQKATLSGLVTPQKDTRDLGQQRRHKAASSAVLFSFSTKAAVLSLAPQTLFSVHSAQGQGRINKQLWWLIPVTIHFSAYPHQFNTQEHALYLTGNMWCLFLFIYR